MQFIPLLDWTALAALNGVVEVAVAQIKQTGLRMQLFILLLDDFSINCENLLNFPFILLFSK